MTDDLDRLRLLHAVSRTGSIAAAAREVSLTPSAVSQQISALERRVGVMLLERSNRGVSMTPAGAVLSERAAVLLDEVDAGFAEAVEVAGARQTTPVRLAAFPTAISSLVLPTLASGRVDVPVTIVHLEPEAAVVALLDRSVDLAIAHSYDVTPTPHPAGLDVDRLMDDHLHLVVPPALRGAAITDLGDVGWVLGPSSSQLGQVGRLLCRQAGIHPRILAETDDHRVSFAIAAAAGAVTVQPALTFADLPADGTLVTSRRPLGTTRRVVLLRRHLARPDPALARLTTLLVARARPAG